ncbi:MAG: hypothetical protein AAFU03_02125 [Bacteroidota bacterium]
MTFRFTLLFALLTTAYTLSAQQFTGIYQPTEAEIVYSQATGWQAFLDDHKQQVQKGLRLIDLESSRVGGDERIYYGIYTQSSLKDSVGMALGWRDFVKLKRLMAAKDFLMVDVHAFALNESDFQYLGVWVKEDIPHKIARLTSRQGLEKRIADMGKRRYKLKRVHVLSTPDGEPEYIALFHYSTVQEYNFLHYTESLEAFQKDLKERYVSNVRLVDYATFYEKGERYHLGVYQTGTYEDQFVQFDNKSGLEAEGKKLKADKGLSLLNLNVYK